VAGGQKDRIVAVDLDEPYSQVCAGDAGRNLNFQLNQTNKLVLFEIEKAAIIKTMEAPSDDVTITAGLEKMILVVSGTKLIHRYSLPALNHEKTVTWSAEAVPEIAQIGCAHVLH
jgi:hypothetical protein